MNVAETTESMTVEMNALAKAMDGVAGMCAPEKPSGGVIQYSYGGDFVDITDSENPNLPASYTNLDDLMKVGFSKALNDVAKGMFAHWGPIDIVNEVTKYTQSPPEEAAYSDFLNFLSVPGNPVSAPQPGYDLIPWPNSFGDGIEVPVQTVGYTIPPQVEEGWFWGIYCRESGDDNWGILSYPAYEDRRVAEVVLQRAKDAWCFGMQSPGMELAVLPRYVHPGTFSWGLVVRRRPDQSPQSFPKKSLPSDGMSQTEPFTIPETPPEYVFHGQPWVSYKVSYAPVVKEVTLPP